MLDVEGEVIEDSFQMCDHLQVPLFEGVQHRHQDPTGVGPTDEVKHPNDVACDSMRWEALSPKEVKDSTVCCRVDPL